MDEVIVKMKNACFQSVDQAAVHGWIGVLLLEGFSSLSVGSILEPFSILRNLNFKHSPAVRIFSIADESVRSSSGLSVVCDLLSSDVEDTFNRHLAPRAIIICGPTITPSHEKSIAPFLRRARQYGIPLFGVGQAAWHMAESGLLFGKSATLHWSCLAAFSEEFSRVDTENALFVCDEFGGTCAGETATLDLIIGLIGSFAPEHTTEICNALLISQVRPSNSNQPGSQSARLRHVPPALARAAQIMADDLENSQPVSAIAEFCGVSVRQLERLFREHLSTSPAKYRIALRTERGKELLLHTELSLREVACAVGYSSVAAFSKKFRSATNLSPTEFRSELANKKRFGEPVWHIATEAN